MGMLVLPLTRRKVALIDDEDADLADLKWRAVPGKRTWYASRTKRQNGKVINIQLHRIVLERKLGRELLPGEFPDHILGDGLDNRRENLRPATNQQNCFNRVVRKDSLTGLRGVGKFRGKYRALIMVNGKQKHLGLFDTPEEAYRVYCDAAKEAYGEFAPVYAAVSEAVTVAE